MLLEDVLTRKDAEKYFAELCDYEIKQSKDLYERFMLPYRQSGSDEMVKQLETALAVECQAHIKAKEKRMELADKYQIYAKYEFPYEIGSQQYKDAVSLFKQAVAEKRAQGFVVIHYKKFAQVTKLNVGKQNYKKPKDYNELKPFLLHELRHIWQLNNPNWKEKYAAKDIDIEVDAFEWQYKLERILEVEPTKQRKEFEKSTTKEEQAKYLWSFYSNRKNNQGDSVYSNTYGFKRK